MSCYNCNSPFTMFLKETQLHSLIVTGGGSSCIAEALSGPMVTDLPLLT